MSGGSGNINKHNFQLQGKYSRSEYQAMLLVYHPHILRGHVLSVVFVCIVLRGTSKFPIY